MKNSKILNIRSVVKDKAPSPDQLELGQIAINANAENPFISTLTDTGEVVKFPSETAVTKQVKENVGEAIKEALGDNYYTKEETDNKIDSLVIPTKTSELINDSNYATTNDIDTAVADKITKATADETYQPKGDYLTEHQKLKTINGNSIVGEGNIIIEGGGEAYDDSELRKLIAEKADKEHTHTISQITDYVAVTKTSQLTNDSGYLTEHQSLDGYAKTTDVDEKISKIGKGVSLKTGYDYTTNLSDVQVGNRNWSMYVMWDDETTYYGNQFLIQDLNGNNLAIVSLLGLSGNKAYLMGVETPTLGYQCNVYHADGTSETMLQSTEQQSITIHSGDRVVYFLGDYDKLKGSFLETQNNKIAKSNTQTIKGVTVNDSASNNPELALKSDIPSASTAPTKVSELENDCKYVNTWEGTKAEYEALTAKSETTLYIITDEDASSMIDLSAYLKTEDAANTYQPKGDYLTEHQPLKTINGNSLVGEGDITIGGSETIEMTATLSDGTTKTYVIYGKEK